VASQCLCDAFEIDLDAAAPEFSLAEIYRAGVESLVRPPLLCLQQPSAERAARVRSSAARAGRAT